MVLSVAQLIKFIDLSILLKKEDHIDLFWSMSD